ncbi:probable cytochrome P450 6d4 [Eurosta solidaginis]|uniref:probable cytochrome P450 6d4 n=1 Tax=Eurosta solidaginis TaxID=178769 RepID=UPI003530AA8D
MRDVMGEGIELREKHNISRKDMLQLLMQLRKFGKVSGDEEDCSLKSHDAIGELKEFTLDHIAAQGVILDIAGQEATSTATAYTIFELAQYLELLARANKEVEEVLERHDGQLSYDALRETAFLELCLQETNRKYPLPFLNRECTQDYTIPGTKYVIEKGTPVVIPLLGIHRDAEYYPNPMAYDPDRFTPLSPNYNGNANAYIPYGAGPSQCVGWPMGMLIAKLSIVKLLPILTQ